MDLLWVFLGYGIGVVVHEAGHALAGVASGLEIHMVSLGEGYELLRFRYRETWIRVRVILWCGEVVSYPSPTHHKYKEILFILGGVLGNAMLLAFIVALHELQLLPRDLQRGAGLIGMVQLYLIALSLFPRRDMLVDAALLALAFKTPHGAPSPYMHAYGEMVRPYCNGGEPPQPRAPAELRVCYHLHRDSAARLSLEDIYHALEREWARGGLAPELEMHLLDSLITRALMSETPVPPQKLDAWSQRALELGPTLPTLQGSRGAALVEIGRAEEGKAMLESVLAAPAPNRFDILMSQVFLTKAESLLGRREQASEWLAKAWATARLYEPPRPELQGLILRIEKQALAETPPVGGEQ